MPIYEVIKGGLIKDNSINEYQIGDKFETKSPIKDQATLNRVRVLSASAQVEFVNQLQSADTEDATEDADFNDQRAATFEPDPEPEINVIVVSFDVDKADKEALLAKAKELGIKGAHLFGEKRLREEVKLLLDK